MTRLAELAEGRSNDQAKRSLVDQASSKIAVGPRGRGELALSGETGGGITMSPRCRALERTTDNDVKLQTRLRRVHEFELARVKPVESTSACRDRTKDA